MELPDMVWRIITPLVLMALSITNTAEAYPLPVDFSGKLSRWNSAVSDQLTIRVHGGSDVSELYSTIASDAAAKWSEVPTSSIQLAMTSVATENILITFTRELTNAPHSAGYTEFDLVDEDTGELQHCSITILTTQALSDLANTVLHELGHCLGLGHSLIPESIMSYDLRAHDFRLDLDDVAAVTRLYPFGGGGAQLPPGCSVLSLHSKPYPSSKQSLSFLALAVLLIVPAAGRIVGQKKHPD
jgi:predicted Zn-dependent protease